jgi:hypothetical protein
VVPETDGVKLMKGLVFWPLIHFVFCWGSFRAYCILWGVQLVEDGVATYMSIFDQPVNSEMGCSLNMHKYNG